MKQIQSIYRNQCSTKTWVVWLFGIALIIPFIVAPDPFEPTPAWLGGRRDWLPPVSRPALDVVRRFWPAYSRREYGSCVAYAFEPDVSAAIRHVGALGTEAVAALIWLWAENATVDTSKATSPLMRESEFRILTALAHDEQAVRWLIPLVRVQLDWVAGRIPSADAGKIEFLCRILTNAEYIMTERGTKEDVRRVFALQDALLPSPDLVERFTSYRKNESHEHRWEMAMLRQQVARNNNMPFNLGMIDLIQRTRVLTGERGERLHSKSLVPRLLGVEEGTSTFDPLFGCRSGGIALTTALLTLTVGGTVVALLFSVLSRPRKPVSLRCRPQPAER